MNFENAMEINYGSMMIGEGQSQIFSLRVASRNPFPAESNIIGNCLPVIPRRLMIENLQAIVRNNVEIIIRIHIKVIMN